MARQGTQGRHCLRKCSKTKPGNLKPSPRALETERMCAGLTRILGSCGHCYIHLCLRCPSLIETAACYVSYEDMGPDSGHKGRRGTMPWSLTKGTMQVRIQPSGRYFHAQLTRKRVVCFARVFLPSPFPQTMDGNICRPRRKEATGKVGKEGQSPWDSRSQCCHGDTIRLFLERRLRL